jgi:hypothetical protein
VTVTDDRLLLVHDDRIFAQTGSALVLRPLSPGIYYNARLSPDENIKRLGSWKEDVTALNYLFSMPHGFLFTDKPKVLRYFHEDTSRVEALEFGPGLAPGSCEEAVLMFAAFDDDESRMDAFVKMARYGVAFSGSCAEAILGTFKIPAKWHEKVLECIKK